jgi:hypothetical protein
MEKKNIEIKSTKEYAEGWNANNRGDHFLSNPYFFSSPRSHAWNQGFNDNQEQWNGAYEDPKPMIVPEFSALDIL